MVLDELKRVSTERDKFREELDQAKQKTKEAWDEVANLRKITNTNESVQSPNEEVNESRSKEEHSTGSLFEDDSLSASRIKPNSTKSRTGSIISLPLFSPGAKPTEVQEDKQNEEDFFSYDTELPRLESELKNRQNETSILRVEVKTLKGDLSVARESTQSMVGTLEVATRELQALQERKDQSDADFHAQRLFLETTCQQLRTELHEMEDKLRKSEAANSTYDIAAITKIEQRLKEKQDELEMLRSGAALENDSSHQIKTLTLEIKDMESEIEELRAESKQSEKRSSTLDSLVKSLRAQLLDADEEKQRLATQIANDEKSRRILQHRVTQLQLQIERVDLAGNNADDQKKMENATLDESANVKNDAIHTGDATTVGKKKNKKKKKAGKAAKSHDSDSPLIATTEQATQQSDQAEVSSSTQVMIVSLQEELDGLRALLKEKDAAIERIHGKLKDQEDLREEIETLRDDLVNVGQEHVQAKEKVKDLLAENRDLLKVVQDLEIEVARLHDTHASSRAGSEEDQKIVAEQLEKLKTKLSTLQIDLAAAQQLASSRFKDLTELRSVLQKAQPEMITLRSEVADSKAVKETLVKKEAEFSRLDARHEEIRAEVIKLKQSISDQDSEIKTLKQKIVQETTSRLKAEDITAKSRQEFQHVEVEKRQATESLDKMSRDLAKSRDDLVNCRTRLRELEQQLSQNHRDNEGLREDVELKAAQYASAQSLMASMRDQTAEMAMQMKEARDRCESLDEEVAEAHKLLSERSREGETMRRLLADIEARAESRTREWKERMETAIEERDRAEDEASTAGRRMARELEDLRNRVRESERGLKRAEEDKEELEIAQRDWKRRREELEQKSEQHANEVDEVRKAMGELRDALDESERQARELERQKAEMRRSVEDTQHRLEKLQKSNKVRWILVFVSKALLIDSLRFKSMADEIRTIQTAKTKAIDSETQSSRSSSDSTRPRARLGSPAPKNTTGSASHLEGANGQAPGPMDYIYLKNVLLQFLEQKDKKHQVQLIPVLGMLLHFDRYDYGLSS